MASASLRHKAWHWQEQAVERWEAEGDRGVVAVVTGGGKTYFALLAYQRLVARRPDARLVVVVPTIALLDQWAVTLVADLKVQPEDLALISGENPRGQLRRISVIVINTARRRAESLSSDDPVMLVVDECHRAGSPENAHALRIPAVATLGLSATPKRQWDDGFEDYVAPALGPIIYEYGYQDARRDGLIPDIEILNYRFHLQSNEAEEYATLTKQIARRWSKADDPYNDPALKRLLIRRSRVSAGSPARVVAAVALSERFPQRGLIFHEQIERAEAIARLLDRRGTRVAIYHSKMGSVRRRRNLECSVGQVTKLVTCRALDEGLNVPDAEVAIIAASTTSQRQRIQRLGRVMRATKGKDRATVCTLFATDPERRALDKEAVDLDEVAEIRWFEVTS